MKKIVLSALIASSLLMAEEVDQEQLKIDIATAKEEASKAQGKVEELEAQLPANEDFITHVELGFIKTEGNTVTTSFNLDFDLKKNWGRHSLTYNFDGQYAEDKHKETKNKFFSETEYNYQLTDDLYAVYMHGYKQDKFSGFNSQTYTGAGLKYYLIKTSTQTFDLEGELLYAEDDIEDVEYNSAGEIIEYPNADDEAVASITSGEIDDYVAYRIKGVYSWQMLENLKFEQEATYRAEIDKAEKYFVFSQTAFSSKISDIFSAGISYKVDYTNTPPNEKERTDTTLSMNLILDY